MKKIIKYLLTFNLFTIFGFFTISAFAAEIIGCSNCKSDTSFGKIYNFDKRIFNLKSDEFVVFWNGYVGTDELMITHKGIIKNSKIIPVSELNINELCVFGITDFPNIDGKYPNTLNVSYAKKIKSRYFLWEEEFNKNSIDELTKFCLGKRKALVQNYPLETKYKCDLNHSSCKIIKFNDSKIQNANSESPKTNLNLKGWTDSRICFFALNDDKTDWTKNYQYIDHVEEARRRDLDCGIISTTKIIVKEDLESKKLAEKRALELDEERNRLKAMEIEKKRLEEKNKQLSLKISNPLLPKVWCKPKDGKGKSTRLLSHWGAVQNKNLPSPPLNSSGNFNTCNKYQESVPIAEVRNYFMTIEGKKWLCNLLRGNNNKIDFSNDRLRNYYLLSVDVGLSCEKNQEELDRELKIKKIKEKAIKVAEENARKYAEKKFLKQQKILETEKKRLEEKTKQLAEQNRLAELNAQKRSEEIAKEVAAQEREKLEEERALRRAEEKARKIAQEKAKQLAAEREKAEKVAKQLELERVIAEKKNKERLKILDEERKKSEKIAKQLRQERIIAEQKNKERLKKLDEERKKSEKIARQLRQERIIAEEKNKERLKRLDEERKKSDKIAAQLRKERKIAEQKARELEKSQQTQLASIQREKEKREELIQEEKKKRVELEKKLAELREQNKNQQSKTGKIKTIKLPPEWMPFQNKMSLQQEQFCQLTNRFFKDIKKATSSGNEIKVNIVHKERQENMDGLLPGGKVNNWIFKVVKIDQVEDGSAAVVLKLQCKSFVGSGQIHTKSTWRKKSNKEWRATIPYEDRRFRELAKLDRGQFILGSGTMLEINAFKPGQKETFYASQQIGEHPLTKGLNLEGELFIADLSYIAALN